MIPYQRQHSYFHIFVGLALITWGVLAVLDNLHIVDGYNLLQLYWPGLLLIGGAGLVIVGHRGQRFVGVFLTLVGLTFLLNRVYGWHLHFWVVVWPLLLIGLGLRLIFGSHDPWHAV